MEQAFSTTSIPGCRLVCVPGYEDARGSLVKTWSSEALSGLVSDELREVFFTISRSNVLRGLHFQIPPAAHWKLVYCVSGKVLDLVLDLRRGSPSFGRPLAFDLVEGGSIAVLIPPGCAHGFQVTTEPAIMAYHVTSKHIPELDRGVLWSSIDFNWPSSSPVVSHRDAGLPPFDTFESPFEYDEGSMSMVRS
jgi:dTDP-4-dehydrorhamnose 3,5-epimerase